jgi:hypothetical protein
MHTEVGTRRRARPTSEHPTEARRAVANIAVQLVALRTMSVAELHDEYRRLFGEPSRSRNKRYLQKRLAWRIQELAEGGLSTRARDRIEQLLEGNHMVRFRPHQQLPADPAPLVPGVLVALTKGRRRDARLPPAGTLLRKEHGGEIHDVTVLEKGFEYRGNHFTSLSTLAKVIAGATWNGFAFFGLAGSNRT